MKKTTIASIIDDRIKREKLNQTWSVTDIQDSTAIDFWVQGMECAKNLIISHFNENWILVEESMPKEHDSIFAKYKGTDRWNSAMFEKISYDVNVTVVTDGGDIFTTYAHTVDGKWSCDIIRLQKGYKIIAWRPFPDPYDGHNNVPSTQHIHDDTTLKTDVSKGCIKLYRKNPNSANREYICDITSELENISSYNKNGVRIPHYVYVLNDYEKMYTIRIPGHSVGSIIIDENNTIVDISIYDYFYYTDMYPKNVNQSLNKYVGYRLVLVEE